MNVEDIVQFESKDGEVYIHDLEEEKWYEPSPVKESEVPEDVKEQLDELLDEEGPSEE